MHERSSLNQTGWARLMSITLLGLVLLQVGHCHVLRGEVLDIRKTLLAIIHTIEEVEQVERVEGLVKSLAEEEDAHFRPQTDINYNQDMDDDAIGLEVFDQDDVPLQRADKRSLMSKRQPVPFFCNKYTAVCRNKGIGPKVTFSRKSRRPVCVCMCPVRATGPQCKLDTM